MPYIQGGVRSLKSTPIPTKRVLKELAALRPETLEFYDTSHPVGVAPIRLDTLPEGQKLVIVGPDPYNKRAWYANIERLSTGRLHVS